MAEQELQLIIRLRDEMSSQLRQVNAEIKANSDAWKSNYSSVMSQAKEAGIAIGAFGAVITGAFALSYQAAESQRIETVLLSNTLKNLGTDYDSVKTSLNGYLESTQKSTGIAKSDQISGLQSLLLITQDYKRSMELLPIALDLAKAKQMDVSTSALLLGRVAEGNINALQRYGFSMEGIKSPGEALIKIQNEVSGSAVATKSPLDDLNNAFTDLKENIGVLVAGPIGKFITFLADAVDGVAKWAEKNPELASTLADVALAIGVVAVIVGLLSVAAFGLAASLAFLGGPVTLVILGIMGIIAAGVFLILEWDKIKAHWAEIWQAIKTVMVIFGGPIGFMIGFLTDLAAGFVSHWDSAKGFWANIWNEIKFIALTAINDIIGIIDVLLGGIEKIGSVFGKDWKLQISKISEDAFDIYRKPLTFNGQGYDDSITGFGYGAGGAAPSGGLTNLFGNYGNIGQTGVLPGGQAVTININNQGSVISQQDLMQQIRQELLKLGIRASGTGISQ